MSSNVLSTYLFLVYSVFSGGGCLVRGVCAALEVAVSTVLAVCIMIYTCTMEGEKSHDDMTACSRDPGPMTTQHNPTIDTIDP